MNNMNKGDFIRCIFILIIWSTSSAIVSIITDKNYSINPVVLAGIVVFLSFVILSVFSCIKKIADKKHKPRKYLQGQQKELILPSALGLFFYPIFYFSAISGSSPIKANIFNYLWPLIAGLVEWVVNKNKVAFSKVMAFVTGFIGAYITIINNNNPKDPIVLGEWKYLLLALLGAISYGVYTAVLKNHIPKSADESYGEMNDFDRMYIMIKISLLLHIIVLAWFALFDYKSVIATFGIFTSYKLNKIRFFLFIYAIINFTVAHFLWNKVNVKNNVTFTSSIAFIIPFISTLILVWIQGKQADISSVIGLILIVSSNILLNKEKINSINMPIIGTVLIIVINLLVPYSNSYAIKNSAKYFLEILIAVFAIIYGFILNKVVNDYKGFEDILDEIHIEKISRNYDEREKNNIKQLEKQIVQSVRMNQSKKYADYSTHIDDHFSEEDDYGLMRDYYKLYRMSNDVLTISEKIILIVLALVIIILCFMVRDNNILSLSIIMVIGSTLVLCISVLFEYSMKKKTKLDSLIK